MRQPFTVDFHTHVFPDALAKKAMSKMARDIAEIYPPVSDGTVSGLLANMQRWRVDISVSLPVVTNPAHFRTVNEFAAEMNARIPQIEFFGGLYPRAGNWKENIGFIASLGLKGIKLHPEYQDFSPGDREYFPLYDYALSRGLILVFHAGGDPVKGTPPKSNPAQFAAIADAMKGGVIVAAHLGGNMQWDESEELLAGKSIYMDTSTGFKYYGKSRFLSVAKKHGAERLLFASDSPWDSAGSEMAALLSLCEPSPRGAEGSGAGEAAGIGAQARLTEREIRLIAGENAARILGIPIPAGLGASP